MRIEITVTVIDARTGARADVLVRGPANTPVSELLPALAKLIDGARPPAYVGDSVLELADTVGNRLREGDIITFGAPGEPQPPPGPRLRVVGGHGAGSAVSVNGHDVLIGRDPDCDLRLSDPLVSRHHARLTLGHGDAHLTDLGSTNGCVLGATVLRSATRPLHRGGVVALGDTRLALGDDGVDAATRPASTGIIEVNRAPRLRAVPSPVGIVWPKEPELSRPRSVPLTMTIAPGIAGLVMAAALHRPEYLWFSVVTPLLALAQALGSVVVHRRRRLTAHRAHAAAEAEATAELSRLVEGEERRRREEAPDPAHLLSIARGPTSRLWERRPVDEDFLRLRLGLCDEPLDVQGSPQSPTAHDVPVTITLSQLRAFGVCGPRPQAVATARWLVGQAAALHSPAELRILLLTTAERASEWTWARWLPHLRRRAGDTEPWVGLDEAAVIARVAELSADLSDEPGDPATGRNPMTLLVVDGSAALRRIPGLSALFGARNRTVAICIDDSAPLLPGECGAWAAVSAARAHLTLAAGASTATHLLADLPDGEWAERLARALAPLRDATPQLLGLLPSTVRWSRLAGVPLDDEAKAVTALTERWQRGGATKVLLGVAADGPFSVDLCADGPHALVAGRTGAGKSELLKTMVAGLAAENSPAELSFLLIDYKGGAAFGAAVQLPHCVGLVTDLDPALTERALASLAAELRRRESVLAHAAAPDLEAYRRAGGVLARLVIVVDEFASLAAELPEFVRGLVEIARRGRSLGIHLVLATQRPEGVVNPEIRANTNLRLCLAVTRSSESRDVIDSPAAVTISRETPGRAYACAGHGELVLFQSAQVDGHGAGEGESIDVVALPWPSGSHASPVSTSGESSSEFARFVRAARTAAALVGADTPHPPWLPPLPALVSVADLPSGHIAPYAVADVPHRQERQIVGFDPSAHGHLLAVGRPRSGRTTLLRTLAASLARTRSVDDLHLYAIDPVGALGGLNALPHCGAVVSAAEPERLELLLNDLVTQATARHDELARRGLSSVYERADNWTAPPSVVLLVDRFETLTTTLTDEARLRVADCVHQLLRDGHAAGIHVVIATDRTGLTGRLAAAISAKVILALNDPADYTLAGVARKPAFDEPPGRGYWIGAGPPLLAQIAVLGSDASGSGQSAALAELAEKATELESQRGTSRPPRRIEALPPSVWLEVAARMPPARHRAATAEAVVLGAGVAATSGGFELCRVDVHLGEVGGSFTVTGRPRSGRSSTLLMLARQLAAANRHVVAIAPQSSPLRRLSGEAGVVGVVTDRSDTAQLEQLLTATDGRSALVVDDAELLVDAPIAAMLESAAKQAPDVGRFVLVAAGRDELMGSFRGLLAAVRRSRSGLLLCPDGALAGEPLGVRVPKSALPSATTPGRGLLVVRGELTCVQVALTHDQFVAAS